MNLILRTGLQTRKREANAEFKAAQSAIMIGRHKYAPMKRGDKIIAAMDIKFSGDNTCIERGRKGVIESAGRMACNVWFEGYDKNHLVLCLWEMIAPRKTIIGLIVCGLESEVKWTKEQLR